MSVKTKLGLAAAIAYIGANIHCSADCSEVHLVRCPGDVA